MIRKGLRKGDDSWEKPWTMGIVLTNQGGSRAVARVIPGGSRSPKKELGVTNAVFFCYSSGFYHKNEFIDT